VIVAVTATTGRLGFVGLVVTIVGSAGFVVDTARGRYVARHDPQVASALARFRAMDRAERIAVFTALRSGIAQPEVAQAAREQAARLLAQPRPWGMAGGGVLVALGLVLARGASVLVLAIALLLVLSSVGALWASVRQRERARRLLETT